MLMTATREKRRSPEAIRPGWALRGRFLRAHRTSRATCSSMPIQTDAATRWTKSPAVAQKDPRPAAAWLTEEVRPR